MITTLTTTTADQASKTSSFRHVFDTERLRVFACLDLRISDFFSAPRQLFVAFPLDDEHVHAPMPVVTALLGDYHTGAPFVDWLEVASLYQRQGFATEFLTGLRRFVGPLIISGATFEGEEFVRSLDDKAADADLPHLEVLT